MSSRISVAGLVDAARVAMATIALSAVAVPLPAALRMQRLSNPSVDDSLRATPHAYSPDGEWVLYSLAADSGDWLDLWSVRRAGGAPPVRLSPPLAAGELVTFLGVTPDSRRVVYAIRTSAPQSSILCSVPIGGPDSESVRLSPVPIAGGGVGEAKLSPDGSRVVFSGDLASDEVSEIWSVPTAGPAAATVRISPTPAVGSDASGIQISPTSQRVIFHQGNFASKAVNVWSVPIAGPAQAAVRISPPAGTNRGAEFTRFMPDGDRALMMGTFATPDVSELWSAPVAAPTGSYTRLNPAAVSGGEVRSFEFSPPDGDRIVFAGDLVLAGTIELWSVPVVGPASGAVRLHPPAPPSGGLDLANGGGWARSHDGRKVIFDAMIDGFARELWSAPVEGPGDAAVRLASVALGYVAGRPQLPFLSPDGTRVTFFSDQANYWAASVEGAPDSAVAVTSSTPSPDNQPILDVQFTPDSSRLVYSGAFVPGGKFRAYSTAANGSFPEQALTEGPFDNPDWELFVRMVIPASGEILLSGTLEMPPQSRLYSMRLEESTPARIRPEIELRSFFVFPSRVSDPDSVLLLASPDSEEETELWIVDSRIFNADFDEEGDTSEWSEAVQ